MREVVTRWYGVFVVEDGRTVTSRPYPTESAALLERMQLRRVGARTEEEEQLLSELAGAPALARDRRLVRPGGPELGGGAEPTPFSELGFTRAVRRDLFLEAARGALASAWDPSIHVEEAVRAVTDLDGVANSLGERLVSWGSRDLVDLLEEDPTADRIARRLTDEETAVTERGPVEPELVRARRELAELYQRVGRLRSSVEAAIAASMPQRAPNLSTLLGPALAGRLVALAGGLDRLARLPASTVQVLGAERAFFEHLRGRAPPPRHGVLFLHPLLQGAPRRQRGRLARALAAKAAIAARLDQAGTPLRSDLVEAWEARAKAIRTGPAPRAPGTSRRRLRPPLHRAAEDR